MTLANDHGAALATKVGASPTDSDVAFHRKVQAYLAQSAGITSTLLATRLATQIAGLQPWGSSTEIGQELAAYTAINVLQEFKPTSMAEAMLVAQLWGVHESSTAFLRRANFPDQPAEFVDANVNRAARLMRLFTEQLEALAKLKGKAGHQRMTVEHVNVYPGGQAIVSGLITNAPDTGGRTGGDGQT